MTNTAYNKLEHEGGTRYERQQKVTNETLRRTEINQREKALRSSKGISEYANTESAAKTKTILNGDIQSAAKIYLPQRVGLLMYINPIGKENLHEF